MPSIWRGSVRARDTTDLARGASYLTTGRVPFLCLVLSVYSDISCTTAAMLVHGG